MPPGINNDALVVDCAHKRRHGAVATYGALHISNGISDNCTGCTFRRTGVNTLLHRMRLLSTDLS